MHFFRYVLTAIILLLPVFASAQQPDPAQARQGDAGIQYVLDNDLTETLNLSETDGSFTITLEQAYADANRIAIWYNVTATEDVTVPLSGSLINEVSLWTPEGEWFGAGGGGGGSSPNDDGSLQGFRSFGHQEDLPEDGTYDLTLRFGIVIPEVDENGMPQPAFPVASPDEYDALIEFDLSLTGYEAIVLEPQLSTESNDIEITLESLHMTPSQTNVVLCFELPDGGDWQPNVQLQLGELTAAMGAYGFAGGQMPSPEDTSRCSEFRFYIPYDSSQPQQAILTIDRLQTSVPEYNEDILARATERLAEQGITVAFELGERGMGYDIIESPEDMSESEVGMMVFDAMREFYEGDWTFELTIEPQA